MRVDVVLLLPVALPLESPPLRRRPALGDWRRPPRGGEDRGDGDRAKVELAPPYGLPHLAR
eukprot:13891974-Alexandrium_andersonii.AAC.1